MGDAYIQSKGQILSLEVIVTFSFFLAAILIFIVSWNAIFATYQQEAALRQMQTSLVGISDMLVMSPGDPADWEVNAMGSASSFGLATTRGILSRQKIIALQSLNSSYDSMRESMGAGISNLYIEVGTTSGVALYSFGRPFDPSDRDIYSASADRLALLDGQLVKVRVQLWRSKR